MQPDIAETLVEDFERGLLSRRQLASRLMGLGAALSVIPRVAEHLVAPAVAGGEEGVVNAPGRVLNEREDRSSPIGDKDVADQRNDPPDCDAAVFHRHEFVQIIRIEGPGVDDLLTFGVDDFDPLAFANPHGLTLPRWDFNHRASPLGLTVDEFNGAC